MKSKKSKIIFATIFGILFIAYFLLFVFVSKEFSTPMLCLLVCAGFSFFSLNYKNTYKNCTEYVLGEVIDVSFGNGLGTTGYPLVRFEVDGVEYKIWYNFSTNGKSYKKGDEFWVKYNPQNPMEITQEDTSIQKMVKIMPIIAIVSGVMVIISTLFVFIT